MASYHEGGQQRSILSLASMEAESRLSNALLDSFPPDMTRSGQVSSNFTRFVYFQLIEIK
jgi:hypothetical protein